jgi:hypothetical protein
MLYMQIKYVNISCEKSSTKYSYTKRGSKLYPID